MWFPAFDAWGYTYGWKVVVLAHSSCSPWARPWLSASTVLWGGVTVGSCETWRKNAISAITALHPSVVIPVGTVADTDASKSASPSQLATAISGLVTSLKASRLTPLLLRPIPNFLLASSPTTCFSAHANNLTSCEVTNSQAATTKIVQGYITAAASSHTTLIPTQSLFCGPKYCPIFVKVGTTTYIVYEDGYHMSHQYSQILGAALGPLLNAVLPMKP